MEAEARVQLEHEHRAAADVVRDRVADQPHRGCAAAELDARAARRLVLDDDVLDQQLGVHVGAVDAAGEDRLVAAHEVALDQRQARREQSDAATRRGLVDVVFDDVAYDLCRGRAAHADPGPAGSARAGELTVVADQVELDPRRREPTGDPAARAAVGVVLDHVPRDHRCGAALHQEPAALVRPASPGDREALDARRPRDRRALDLQHRLVAVAPDRRPRRPFLAADDDVLPLDQQRLPILAGRDEDRVAALGRGVGSVDRRLLRGHAERALGCGGRGERHECEERQERC